MVESSGRRFPLGEGQSWAIGSGDGCAVMLDSRSVSRLHALIQLRDAGCLALVDLGSRNGSVDKGTVAAAQIHQRQTACVPELDQGVQARYRTAVEHDGAPVAAPDGPRLPLAQGKTPSAGFHHQEREEKKTT